MTAARAAASLVHHFPAKPVAHRPQVRGVAVPHDNQARGDVLDEITWPCRRGRARCGPRGSRAISWPARRAWSWPGRPASPEPSALLPPQASAELRSPAAGWASGRPGSQGRAEAGPRRRNRPRPRMCPTAAVPALAPALARARSARLSRISHAARPGSIRLRRAGAWRGAYVQRARSALSAPMRPPAARRWMLALRRSAMPMRNLTPARPIAGPAKASQGRHPGQTSAAPVPARS